ncbi:type VI secretion system-associated protein TagF [Roseomonas marmotae]|uniref:Type VI secretion system-associated protein TagF n=1 Tax=Roseomonas marmotae TaxID=2768161 RepID=A0ABS3K895_9PROT|nr:type VI secretion system-associated protein TagF [Roseomonas marmotae]MBO1073694.1 type VI secretion system-associated protein TagF [Roseomonas marmotae]QTI78664.1 type VI secretion system-associated protein TagF [Roseomonas marmotae]
MSTPAISWPAAPAGYHGKVPARSDFVGAGLPPAVIARWDDWLQQALAASQARLGAAWEDRYRAAPLWRFALTEGVCGPLPLIGVLMPSMDAVGRCFPLMLGRQIPAEADPLALLAGSGAWFAAAEARALRALDGGFDPLRLGERLPSPAAAPCMLPPWEAGGAGHWLPLPALSAAPAALGEPAGPVTRPAGARGLWCTAGAPHLAPGVALTHGLVPPAAFAALLDGAWQRHGWSVAAPAAPEAAEWDRDA